MRPEDLAVELGVEGKRLRQWLRGRWPRKPEEHGLPWHLGDEQVVEARRAFAGARPRSSRPVIIRAGSRRIAVTHAAVAPARAPTSWPDLQRYADAVLACGLKSLLAVPMSKWGPITAAGPGVYLIRDDKGPIYVGEAISASARVRQHQATGSKFLGYLGRAGIADAASYAGQRLQVSALPVVLGRLELEEFAVACLRPPANTTRRLSRTAARYEDADPALWTTVQAASASLLRAGVRLASDVAPVPWPAARPPPGAGLYIARDPEGKVIYVGETDALEEPLGTHGGDRSYFSALRRHVGIRLLNLTFAPTPQRGFAAADEAKISRFLLACTLAVIPISIGRWELERELVHEHDAALNREHGLGTRRP